MSSVEISAFIKFSGNSWCLMLLLFSKKYFPNNTPSSEIISVAKLFLGFSNCSKVGRGPKTPIEVRYMTENNPMKGEKITSHISITFFLLTYLDFISVKIVILSSK